MRIKDKGKRKKKKRKTFKFPICVNSSEIVYLIEKCCIHIRHTYLKKKYLTLISIEKNDSERKSYENK